MRFFALACLMLVAGALSGQQQPDRLGEVRGFHQWTKVNPKPVEIAYWVDLLCRIPSAEEIRRADSNPHRLKSITVYVNDVGRKAMMQGGTFPVGSAIVKEKFAADSKEVELATVMIKRPKGYNSACGDWEFAVLDKSGERVQARGKLAPCASCHVEQAKLDFVYRSYVPGK